MTIVTNHPTCCNLLFRKNYNLQHSFKFFRFSFITILRNIVNYTRTIKFLAILQPEQNAKMLSLLVPSIKSRSKILSNQESWFLLFKLATKIIGLLLCTVQPNPYIFTFFLHSNSDFFLHEFWIVFLSYKYLDLQRFIS